MTDTAETTIITESISDQPKTPSSINDNTPTVEPPRSPSPTSESWMKIVANQDDRLLSIEKQLESSKTNIFQNCIDCIHNLTKTVEKLTIETSLLKLKVGFKFDNNDDLLNFIRDDESESKKRKISKIESEEKKQEELERRTITAFASPTQFQTTQKISDRESNSDPSIVYTNVNAQNVRKLPVNQRQYDYRLQDYRIDNGDDGNSNDNTKIICKDSLNNVTIVSVKQEHNLQDGQHEISRDGSFNNNLVEYESKGFGVQNLPEFKQEFHRNYVTQSKRNYSHRTANIGVSIRDLKMNRRNNRAALQPLRVEIKSDRPTMVDQALIGEVQNRYSQFNRDGSRLTPMEDVDPAMYENSHVDVENVTNPNESFSNSREQSVSAVEDSNDNDFILNHSSGQFIKGYMNDDQASYMNDDGNNNDNNNGEDYGMYDENGQRVDNNGQPVKRELTLREMTALIRTTGGDDPYYVCTIKGCQYKNKGKCCLLRHMLTHSSHKSYGCNRCNYRCKVYNSLRMHYSSKHGRIVDKSDVKFYRPNTNVAVPLSECESHEYLL